MGYIFSMAAKLASDRILQRIRAAVTENYGDRVARVVLFGARAVTRGRIPITMWRCFCAIWPTVSRR